MTTFWQPSRAAGLARVEAFLPRTGRAYADSRNRDDGPPADPALPARANVSALSPWVRHRLIEEAELIRLAAGRHGAGAAKFISEVLWRGYFRGWMEQRPEVWTRYRAGLARGRMALSRDRALARDHDAAVEGRTGIDCFDAWTDELVATGWLHNHARMWFASIWIFTLRLPWELGADFFLQHLLDGDAASNTLSWRWVAGLHTPGKHYLARAENIRRYTNGRFDPQGLDEDAAPIPFDGDIARIGVSPAAPLFEAPLPPPGGYALVLHSDDVAFAPLNLPAPARVIGVKTTGPRAENLSPAVTDFAHGAVADGVARAAQAFGCGGVVVDRWADVAAAAGGLPLVAPYLPIGPLRDALAAAGDDAPPVRFIRNAYDDAIWPLATAGFFKVKDKAGKALAPLGLDLPAL